MRFILMILLGILVFYVLWSIWHSLEKSWIFSYFRKSHPELGQASFAAPFLELGMNWRTSVLEGVIRRSLLHIGRGQFLNTLSLEDILIAYNELQGSSCERSCELIRVYMMHRFPHNPKIENIVSQSQQFPNAAIESLTVREARYILGIPQGSPERLVRHAHRYLAKKFHPDQREGSLYLATQINLARDLLLQQISM